MEAKTFFSSFLDVLWKAKNNILFKCFFSIAINRNGAHITWTKDQSICQKNRRYSTEPRNQLSIFSRESFSTLDF